LAEVANKALIKQRNVERACRVAEKEGVSLLGVVRNRSDKTIVKEIEKVLKKHAPKLSSSANPPTLKLRRA
jgi:hypothetical protein